MSEQNRKVIDLSGSLKSPNKKPEVGAWGDQFSSLPPRPGSSKLVQWLIKYSGGLIKNEKQAEFLLIGLLIATIAFSIFLLWNSFRTPHPLSPDEEGLYYEETYGE
jgi:hypothetical protein